MHNFTNASLRNKRGFGGKKNDMKVELTQGLRRGQKVDLPEADAKKLIKKGYAKSLAKKAEAKKETKKSK